MYSKQTVEKFLSAREDGMTLCEAAEFAGITFWAARCWGSGRVGPGFDLEQEQMRARREIEAGDRPAPPVDHRFLEDIEELL